MPKSRKTSNSQTGRSTIIDPRKQGKKAFNEGHFDRAIACWSELNQGDMEVKGALAEAHFRRGLTQDDPVQRVIDMRQAHNYVNSDPRYLYHLGLALHHMGVLDEASSTYRTLIAEHPDWHGAGMVLALAELARNPQIDLSQLPRMNPEMCAALEPVQLLLQGKAPDLPADSPQDDPLSWLWYGLGQVAANDAEAQAALEKAASLLQPVAEAVRQLYCGVLAARAGDTDAALQTWLDVYTADIVRPAWLEDNLVVLVFERLNENVQADRLDEASSALVERVMQTPLRHAALNPLLVAALDQMARQQAIEGAWQQAVLHWEAARQLVSSSSSLGSPRTLLHNLALAYEALEEWTAAAEMWRAMLRTRPRKQKKSDDVPLDYNDEQWAWVRQRVIECYRHAGEPGEAVKVFRQAIKSDPHDLDMRVQLADALRANEQDQASLNELHRILEIDPMHTETHLRLASIHTEYGHWIAAERSLRVVLDQQPEREDVRRQISQLLLTRGHHLHRVGLLDMAHDAFEEGRRFDPDNYRFPLNLARLAIDRNDRATADSLLAEVLAMADDEHEPYLFVIDCYTVLDDIEQARAVLARAEEQQSLSPTFYIQLSKLLLDHSTPAPPLSGLFGSAPEPATPIEGPWLTLALEAIDRAVALQPNDLQVRILLASELMTIYPDMALEHAQAAADLAPEEPSSLILLGLVQALNEQDKEAKATLRRAARLARQQGNMALAEQAEGIRQEVGSPFLRLRLQMQAMGDMFDEEDEDFFF